MNLEDGLEQQHPPIRGEDAASPVHNTDEKSCLESLLEICGETQIESRPDLGRVLVALRDFAVGDVILREAPVLVWESGNWEAFLKRVDQLAETLQNGILDMFHPPLESESCRPLESMALSLRSLSHYSVDKIIKLMAIANANAHEYYGQTSLEYQEFTSFMGGYQHSGSAALFLYASKVAHSCLPNASYSSKTPDGKMEYKCIRPIQRGEMIHFSYLDDIFETATKFRRAKLQTIRDFLCRCSRCELPDDIRRVHCPNCTSGWAMCISSRYQNEVWICQDCGELNSRSVDVVKQKEMEWTAKLISVQSIAHFACNNSRFISTPGRLRMRQRRFLCIS